MLHFLYKSLQTSQITCPKAEAPYTSRRERKRLFRLYQHIHKRVYHRPNRPHSIYYHVSEKESILAWVSGGFILYVLHCSSDKLPRVCGAWIDSVSVIATRHPARLKRYRTSSPDATNYSVGSSKKRPRSLFWTHPCLPCNLIYLCLPDWQAVLRSSLPHPSPYTPYSCARLPSPSHSQSFIKTFLVCHLERFTKKQIPLSSRSIELSYFIIAHNPDIERQFPEIYQERSPCALDTSCVSVCVRVSLSLD